MSSGVIRQVPQSLVSFNPPAPGPDGAGGQITCQVFSSFEALDLGRDQWDAAVLRLGGSVYFTYDWVRIWWGFYGEQRPLRILVFRADGEIVAILPCYIACLGAGPLKLKVARLVGSNLPPKVFDPPVSPPWAAAVFEATLGRIMRDERCGLLSFGPVSHSYVQAKALSDAAAKDPELGTSTTQEGVHCAWSLPPSLEGFYAGLSRNERKNRKADLKKLEVEHSATIRSTAQGGAVMTEFEAFMLQHGTQWAGEGRPGHFGAWPRAAEFNRELAKTQGALGRVRIIRIANDRETIASLYAFAFGQCYYGELPARSLDSRWDKLSLGPEIIVGTISTAISEGMTRMAGGLGHYEYKLRLNAQEEPVNTIRVFSRRIVSRTALAAFTGLRSSLQPFYQKLWRKTLAPRLLPSSAQRQSPWWISLDF